jgi:hypothetical protein
MIVGDAKTGTPVWIAGRILDNGTLQTTLDHETVLPDSPALRPVARFLAEHPDFAVNLGFVLSKARDVIASALFEVNRADYTHGEIPVGYYRMADAVLAALSAAGLLAGAGDREDLAFALELAEYGMNTGADWRDDRIPPSHRKAVETLRRLAGTVPAGGGGEG